MVINGGGIGPIVAFFATVNRASNEFCFIVIVDEIPELQVRLGLKCISKTY
jgi:hypothetical protein